jgi:hypothetical protein
MGIQLTWFSVELHTTIRAVIPSIVGLLKDGDGDVRLAAISAFVKLVEQGEFD